MKVILGTLLVSITAMIILRKVGILTDIPVLDQAITALMRSIGL